MAWKLLLLSVIVSTLCDGLGKRERSHRHGNNKYDAAKKVIDYDELLEEQEENDLFLNDNDNDNEYNEYENNNEYEQYQVPKRRYKRRHHRRYNNPRFSSQIMDDDDSYDEDDSSEEYSDKKQLVAFLLSFFLGGFGAGRFYVGDIKRFAFKLCLPLIVCVGCCIMACLGAPDRISLSGLTNLISGDGRDGGNTLNDASTNRFLGCLTLIAWCLHPRSLACFTLIAWQIWWLCDWILFAMNEIPDGDGKTLIPW
eukprot:96373_1